MTSVGGPPRKRYGLYVLAIVLLLAGAAALILEWNSFAQGGTAFLIWSLGPLMIVASTKLVKASNVRVRSSSTIAGDQNSIASGRKRITWRSWLAGAASLIVFWISYHYLFKDALRGYHQVWPVYAFAGAGLICALALGYLAARLL